ncbi:phosphatase PAP2 family protein [Gillisia hiemivivida]|uniref:Phosphatase PAP2 family protein n=1 Tax=Gillisia hiemivivida TaxID=291190 RepID=A0A5C6ZTI6_9FLAO|nr:phosphatase PAP2 family protein [Gillisia hiemivivida]TXD94045.1 phosphatase PAP2 family protein [Gillisia hiemivivida]
MKEQIIDFLHGLESILRNKFHQYNHKLPFIISIILALIIVVVGINVFVELTNTLNSNLISKYDAAITKYVISFRSPNLNNILQFITNLGDLYGYIVVTTICSLLFYFKFKNWRYVVQLVFVIIVSGLSNLALKEVINRARPTAEHLVSVQTLSYPSGHAMSATAFYGFLIYLCYFLKINKWLKGSLIFLCSFLIVSIGISRIYLGVHFPSDIAGGIIAGTIWLMFCVLILNIIDLFRREEERKI